MDRALHWGPLGGQRPLVGGFLIKRPPRFAPLLPLVALEPGLGGFLALVQQVRSHSRSEFGCTGRWKSITSCKVLLPHRHWGTGATWRRNNVWNHFQIWGNVHGTELVMVGMLVLQCHCSILSLLPSPSYLPPLSSIICHSLPLISSLSLTPPSLSVACKWYGHGHQEWTDTERQH